MADDQGALPDDKELQTAGQASQNQFAAQPTAPTSEPATAGQQTFGGGALPSGTDQSFSAPAGPQVSLPGGAPTQPAPDPQKIQQYMQGAGAMPKSYYDNLRMKIEQSGIKDPNEITAHAVAEGGPPALQATRQHFDTARGFAVKAISDGNLQNAADAANQAFQYVPDGTKANVTATKDNFTVSVHTPDGQAQNYNLTPDQMAQVFKGKDGFFDHMVGKGVNGVIDAITKAQTPDSGFGGPPAGTQQTSQGTAQEATPGVPTTGTAGGYNPSFPGNQAPSPRPSTGNQAPQNAGAPGAAANSQRNPAVPGIQQAGGGEGLGDQTGNQGVNVTYGARGTQTVFPGHKGETRIGNAIFPANTPPDVLYRARQTLPTTVGTPDQQKMAQEIAPGDRSRQAQWIANQNEQDARRQSSENIARGRGAEAAEKRGSYALQVAEARANQMANHPQADMAGQGRNAVKVLSEIRQMNPQITPVDLDNELRHRGINPTNILKPFTPEEQGAPQAQGQPQTQAVSNGPVTTEPTATNQQTGEKMVYRGGKWIPLQ